MRDSLICLKLYVAVVIRQQQNQNGSFIHSTLNPGANILLTFIRLRKPMTHCPSTTITTKANRSLVSTPVSPAETKACRHNVKPLLCTPQPNTPPAHLWTPALEQGRSSAWLRGVVPHSCLMPNTNPSSTSNTCLGTQMETITAPH